jgi:hypothetical protein
MEVSGQLHAPAALPPGKEPPVPIEKGGWVGPRVGLDAVKRKILHCRESNPGRPARSPSLYRLPAYFPYFEKVQVGLCDHHAVCLYIPIYQLFVQLGMYIMAPEPISTTYLINPCYQSVCLYVYPLSLLGNGSVKTLSRQRTHTQQ